MKNKLLTKSRFVTGLSCPTYFWMSFHEPEKIPEMGEEVVHRLEQGHLVGELAKKLFPKGLEAQGESFSDSLTRSKELIRNRLPLFEAGFLDERCYARADVLKPEGKDEWDLIEVKSTGSVKEEHLYDVAFQKRCYENAGLKIRKCFLLHINTQYVKNGEIKPDEIFVQEDISEEVEKLKDSVEEHIPKLLKLIDSKEKPELKCDSPKNCPLPMECWRDLPDDNVFTLYRAGKKAIDLYESGVISIRDIPDGFKLNGSQKIQKDAISNGKPNINGAEIANFVSTLEYPLQFLDFETFSMAIPIFDGTKPYQQISFQFSLDIIEKEGEQPTHYSFLAKGREDPRKAFTGALKKAILEKGSIVVYNASFEKRILKELLELFPSEKWITGAINRLADLLVPFRSFHYYHPKQNGSASIKQVLPAMTGRGYDALAIKNGGMASLKYFKMTYGPNGEKPSEKEAEKIREELEEYCALDTKGMIGIWEALKKLQL